MIWLSAAGGAASSILFPKILSLDKHVQYSTQRLQGLRNCETEPSHSDKSNMKYQITGEAVQDIIKYQYAFSGTFYDTFWWGLV